MKGTESSGVKKEGGKKEVVKTIFLSSVGSVCPGVEVDKDTHVFWVTICTSPHQDPRCK